MISGGDNETRVQQVISTATRITEPYFGRKAVLQNSFLAEGRGDNRDEAIKSLDAHKCNVHKEFEM